MPSLTGISKAVFLLIKPQLDANIRRFENGSKGGRPKTKTKPKRNQNETKTKPNKNNNVNDNVNVNDNQYVGQEPDDRKILNKKYNDDAKEIIEWLNEKADRSFRITETNLGFITARLKSGANKRQCRWIISNLCKRWKGTDQEKYLRPETIFNKTKFEGYFGELPKALITEEPENVETE